MFLILVEFLKLINWLLFSELKNLTPYCLSLKNLMFHLLVFDIQQNSYSKLTSSFSFKNRGSLNDVKAVKSEFFSKFTFSPELLNLIRDAPPLQTPFGKYTLQIGSEVVIAQQIGTASNYKALFLLIDESNGRKLAFITAEGFWKWKLFDYASVNNNTAFEELFSKLTQYLVLASR